MKKDIEIKKVEDIAIAIVPTEDDFWDVYLLNRKPQPLRSVLINSTGYGELNGEAVKTTTLRYFFEEIAPNSATKIELLQKDFVEITNQYWISFELDGYLFDKKYIFVRGSLSEINFTKIPFVDLRGVMIV